MDGFKIVAIGASAGGIRALITVLSSLPFDLPTALLIVQHLEPDHKSMVTQILQKRCVIKIKTAEEGEIIEPSVAYLAPPDKHLLFITGKIALTSSPLVNYSRPSIDVLFKSVAEGMDGRAIGVILTGSNMDGTEGTKAIKQSGERQLHRTLGPLSKA